MAKNTTEQQQVANAPVQDAPEVEQDAPVLTEEQFNALPPFIQQVIEAANELVQRKVTLGAEIAANRTIMRALAGGKQLPADVAEFYYPAKERGPRLSAEQKAEKLRAQAEELLSKKD